MKFFNIHFLWLWLVFFFLWNYISGFSGFICIHSASDPIRLCLLNTCLSVCIYIYIYIQYVLKKCLQNTSGYICTHLSGWNRKQKPRHFSSTCPISFYFLYSHFKADLLLTLIWVMVYFTQNNPFSTSFY